jgi:hypothetical protein
MMTGEKVHIAIDVADELIERLREQCKKLIDKHVTAFDNLDKDTGDIFVQSFLAIVRSFQQEISNIAVDIIRDATSAGITNKSALLTAVQSICSDTNSSFSNKVQAVYKG